MQTLPAGKSDPQQQKVEKVAAACRLLEQETPMTLEALARQAALSPFHFHRLFKSVTGMTPKAWQQAWRARRLREALGQGAKITDAALSAGFPDNSSYYQQADAALGMTARQFRRGGGISILPGYAAMVRWDAVWWLRVNGACAPCYRERAMPCSVLN